MAKFAWFIIGFVFSFVSVFAQEGEPDITGLWKGQLYNDTTQEYLPYELAISLENGKLKGYSYTAFKIEDHYEVGVKEIKIKRKKNKILIEDEELLSNTYSVAPPKGVRQRSVLELSIEDTTMVLSGLWSTNPTKVYRPLTGTMRVERKYDIRKSELVKNLDTLQLSNELSFVKPEEKRVYPVIVNAKQDASKEKKEEKERDALAKQEEKKKIEAEKKILEEEKKAELEKQALAKEELKREKDAEKKAIVEQKKAEKEKELLAKDELRKEKDAEKKAVLDQKKAEKEKELLAKEELKKEKEAAIEKARQDATAAAKKREEEKIAKANAGPAAELTIRKTIVTQTVFYKTDSLIFTLYDNGEVDGDTVTVLMNNKVLFEKEGLSTKANNKTIYIDQNTPDSLHLIMYAENLGSIPPNTGLLVIHDGESIYEVRFSADLQTNAEIILRRKQKEEN